MELHKIWFYDDDEKKEQHSKSSKRKKMARVTFYVLKLLKTIKKHHENALKNSLNFNNILERISKEQSKKWNESEICETIVQRTEFIAFEAEYDNKQQQKNGEKIHMNEPR